MRQPVAILLAVCIAGCSSSQFAMKADIANAASVATATAVTADPYMGVNAYEAPEVYIHGNALSSYYRLRGWTDAKTGKVSAQLYLDAKGADWRHLNSAFAGGQQFPVTRIAQNVGSCSYGTCLITEVVGVALTPEQIRQFAATGLDIKVVGTRGDVVMQIPAAYFQGFQTAIKL